MNVAHLFAQKAVLAGLAAAAGAECWITARFYSLLCIKLLSLFQSCSSILH